MVEQPLERRVEVNGLNLALYEWAGSGPPILFAHANGFHGRCWAPIAELLPGRRRIACDLRGHGQSDKPAPPYRWPDFATDLAVLARALELRGVIGVGHSLGGYASALAAAIAPECFAALLLLDPVILDPAHYLGRLPGEHGVARRRNRWGSPKEFYERLHERPPFNRWAPTALHAYCDHALLRSHPGHDYVLACPPAVEADIYHGASEHSPYATLAKLRLPVVVARGTPYAPNPTENFAASPTYPGVAAAIPAARDLLLTEHSHFIPMESPELTARLVGELVV